MQKCAEKPALGCKAMLSTLFQRSLMLLDVPASIMKVVYSNPGFDLGTSSGYFLNVLTHRTVGLLERICLQKAFSASFNTYMISE